MQHMHLFNTDYFFLGPLPNATTLSCTRGLYELSQACLDQGLNSARLLSRMTQAQVNAKANLM